MAPQSWGAVSYADGGHAALIDAPLWKWGDLFSAIVAAGTQLFRTP
jgi:hypothetical protein